MNETPMIDWNANLAFLQLMIDIKFKDAHNCRRIGDNFGWYSCMRGIYGMIHHKVLEPGNEEDEKKLEDLFSQAQTYMMKNQNSSGANSIALYTLDRIEILLWDLVVDYGFVQLEAEKPQKGHAIKEKFKQQ